MKSYFANSVQSAIEAARRELGADAILVTSRLAPAEAGKPRQYEVVFASDTPEIKEAPDFATPARLSLSTPASSPASSMDAVLREMREMRLQLEALQRAGRSSLNEPAWPADAETRQLLAHFTKADMDPDLAQELLAAARKRTLAPQPAKPGEPSGGFLDALKAAASRIAQPPGDLRAAVGEQIREVFVVDTSLYNKPGAPTIAALIGPPGAGKTATIAKLAVRYGLQLRRPVLLVSMDGMRVAAPEQLRGYASILGLRFEVAHSSRALSQVLEEYRGNGLILVDTPGFSAHELDERNEVVRFLAGRADIQKHLVLPAPARCADTNRVASAYEVFRPSHLIFSRMDETVAFGPVLSAAMGSGRPVSFFTTGQRVPEDVEEASPRALMRRLLPDETEPSIAAAA